MPNIVNIVEAHKTGYGLLIENDAGYLNVNTTENLHENSNTFTIKNGEPILVDCILQRYGVENKNGRIYPKEILEREVSKYMDMVGEVSAIGERNHPDSSNITLGNIPHVIKKMWWKGDTLYGTLEIITSPGYIKFGIVSLPGDEICELLKRKIKLGISSRGVGSVSESNGKTVVQEDFQLICFDLVVNPSTHGAYLFPNGIRQENVENKPANLSESTKNIKKILKNFIKYQN